MNLLINKKEHLAVYYCQMLFLFAVKLNAFESI